MLKHLSVRGKMIMMLTLITVSASLITYLVPRASYKPIIDIIIPRLSITHKVDNLVLQIQEEMTQSIISNETSSIGHIELYIAELETLKKEAAPFLEKVDEDAVVFQTLFNQAEQISQKSYAIITAHQQTIEMLEGMKPLSDDARDLFATHDVSITNLLQEGTTEEDIFDRKLLQQIFLTRQFIESFYAVRLETIEYIANSEDDAFEEREHELLKLDETLAELESIITANDSDFMLDTELIANFTQIRNRITAVSTNTVNTHKTTLGLLDELELLKFEFNKTSTIIQDKIEKSLGDGLKSLAITLLLIAIILPTSASTIGLIAVNKIIVRPLEQLSHSVQKFGKGDMSARVHIKSNDEISRLGNTFNQMAVQLQKNFSDATKRIDELQKTKDRLETANLELEQFAYVAAHDLKSPLRAIANLAEWLEEDIDDAALTDETRRYLQLLHARVHRMESLIDGLRTYSRIGRINSNAEIVHTEKIVRAAVHYLDTPEQFTLKIPPDMPVFNTYPKDLEQVFFQLISNAIKYNHRPTGQIEVTWKENDDFYLFTVSDNGPGIEPEYHNKVFSIFQTLETRDKVESVGLGLPLVKKLVEHHGGKVNMESAVGEGVTIHFSWPK